MFTLLALLIGTILFAQDRIYKRTGEIIETKVIEVGDFEVKYKTWDNQDGPTYVLETNKIKKILFGNGEVRSFDEDVAAPLDLANQRKNAIKAGFLDPLAGFSTLTYERSIKPGRSWEVTVGIIGWGIDPAEKNMSGVSGRFGYKFIKSPDHYIRGMKSAHILKGAYIRPEIVFSRFSEDYKEFDPVAGLDVTKRDDVTAGALLISLGKQVVYDNSFLIDYYFGIGYGFANTSRGDERPFATNYGFAGGNKDFPVALNFGLRIGFLFGK